MLHAKFQDHRTSGSGEIFSGFYHMSLVRKSVFGVSDQALHNINQAVQPHKMARG